MFETTLVTKLKIKMKKGQNNLHLCARDVWLNEYLIFFTFKFWLLKHIFLCLHVSNHIGAKINYKNVKI